MVRKTSRANPDSDNSGLAQASGAGLRYVADTEPGIRRKRRGKGFCYLDSEGKIISDSTIRTRISRLAIPPAYTDVWICQSERGHLQATGRDARGRKQYRYHAKWRSVRDRGKFVRVVDFADRLPALRRRLRHDLKADGFGRDKVLAIVVSIMAQTLIRIGNPKYADGNRSYGLTTLKKRHVEFLRNGHAVFRFRGKGGVANEVALDDDRLTRLLRHCRELPGQMLFQYTDDDGTKQPVDSGLVNDYLRDAMGEEFTAKDFRTWGATCATIALLAETPLPDTQTDRVSKLAEVVKTVAQNLRNTPAVCRKSYIHPVVFDAWSDGSLHRIIGPEPLGNAKKQEFAALRFLRKRLRQKPA